MPVAQACPVTVTSAVRRVLTRRSRGQKTPYRDKVRAQIVLLAACQWPDAAVAAAAGISVDTVRTWRGRFAEQGLAGLADRARSGRPARFTAVQVAQVKALACRLPARAGAPLSRWSCPGGGGSRHRGNDVGLDGMAVVGSGGEQALAVPVVAVSA
ncbi:helix-turn-helix domain-containing protein [Amycolatopsis mediterranei]|uniref:helix-turn-helix domain-containing protein n=1 Tax=Amycolatopsis mediterranei TaxID=33910 RepID=UPI003443A378